MTGHRALAELAPRARAELEERVGGFLTSLRAALEPGRTAVLLSPLAEGADRIAAECALALGWTLDVLLPFAPREYEKDFGGSDSVREFRALLERSRRCRELPAEEPHDPVRDRAYEAVGDALIAASDLVLALWDGDPERGRGGTGQVVRRAVRRGVPVLHVDVEAPFSARTYVRTGLALPPELGALSARAPLAPSPPPPPSASG